MKVCSSCNKAKPINDYYNARRNADGKQGACKICLRAGQVTRKQRIAIKNAESPIESSGLNKTCYKCKREWLSTDFYTENGQLDGRQPMCKKCFRMRAYGLNGNDLIERWESQEARCAGCKDPIDLGDKATHVDHCHKTGRIRGLLCRGCNLALGNVKDNPETLRSLITYLDR